MKQFPNEDVKSFAGHIECAYHALTSALIVNKIQVESQIIAQTVQSNALIVFIEGVSFGILTLFKTQNIDKLDHAITIAIEEEKSLIAWNKPNTFGKKNNKSNIKCNRCSKMGHYASECRSTIVNNTPSFRNPVNKTENKTTYVKQEYQGQVKFCQYCKKANHNIKDFQLSKIYANA